MSITFSCPHCRKPLKVKDELAGKKAKCPGCQKVLLIPGSPSKAPVSLDGKTAGKGDVESLALAALSEPSQPAPATKPSSQATIDFQCPYCDERIRMAADLAGKQAPCPECRRIIKVPLLVKEEPKDWRKIDRRNPLASRRGEDAVPEGAWGSTTSTAKVSRQALLEAKVIVQPKERWTTRQWINRVLAGVAALVVVAGSLWAFVHFTSASRKNKAFNRAEELARSQDLDLLSAAEVYRGLGAFQRRAEQSREGKDSADLARDLFGEARAKLSAEPKETPERDAQLIDLALDQIDLGGDQQQVIKRTRLQWDDIAREVRQTLQQVRSSQARLEGLREVESELIRLGQNPIAVNLPGSLLDPNDADRSEALGQLGLLLLNEKEQAAIQEMNARQAFTGKKDAKGKFPAASWIALNLALGRNEAKEAAPRPEGAGPDVPLSIRVGYAWGWAYLGQIEDARKLAKAAGPAAHQFQAYLAIAEAQVHKKDDAKQDLEAAANLIELALKEKEPELSPWLVFRLVRLSLQAGDPGMAAQLADRIPDSGLRSRAQVEVKLSGLQQADMEALTAAAQQKPACPHALLTLARHNARYGSSSAVLKIVESWEPDALRPLGYIGVALGMQDRER